MKILCAGSLNIDRVYTVSHFVRAGETIASRGYGEVPGGKGLNQSVALARAGAEVWHAGKIGGDGAMLRNALREAGVRDEFLRTGPTPTGHAVIQVDERGQNSIIVEAGANGALEQDELAEALDAFGPGDLLLLQNEINLLPWLLREGRRRGLTVVLNPSPVTEGLKDCPLDCVDLFLLNEIEGALLSGTEEIAAIPQALLDKYPGAKVVLTLGSRGSLYYDGERIVRQAVFPVEAVDTTAAGDTFTGYFLAALAQNRPVEEALERASAASALAVTRKGASVSIPTRAEVEAFLNR